MWHRSWEHKGRKENVFKVFSFEKLEDKWLEGVFGEGTLGWIRRAEVSLPAISFPSLVVTDTYEYAVGCVPRSSSGLTIPTNQAG